MTRGKFLTSLVMLNILLTLTILFQSLFAIVRLHDVFPFYDMILVDFSDFSSRWQDFWFLADNEHRPLFAMPLFWIDLHVFGDQEIFLVICNLVLAGAIVAVLWRAVARAAQGNRALAALACALIMSAMFWLANATNLSWPKQVHMYLSVFALTLAFQRAASSAAVRVRGAIVISAFLFVSTFSFAFGIIGFPAVALIAFMRRWNWRPASILALGFLTCVVLYAFLTDSFYFVRGDNPSVTFAFPQTLSFAVTFISAPAVYIGRAFTSETSALAIGRTLTIAGLATFAWRALRGFMRPPGELEAWALLLAAFATGNAIQTALARAARFGLAGALEHRYVIGELPFWIGLVLLAVPFVAARSGRRLFAAAAAGLAVQIGILTSQQAELGSLRIVNAIHWRAAISAIANVPDRVFFDQYIWIRSDQVIAVIDGLRARHWSVFAWPEATWIGQKVDRFIVTDHPCRGHVDVSTPVAGEDGSLVQGWAADKRVSDWSAWVLLADNSGTITGLARGGVVDQAPARKTKSLFSGWLGYARGSAAGSTITAYLVLPGNRACPLELS